MVGLRFEGFRHLLTESRIVEFGTDRIRVGLRDEVSS